MRPMDEAMLKELGLWPVWRRKSHVGTTPASLPADVQAVRTGVAQRPAPLAQEQGREEGPEDERRARIHRMDWDELMRSVLSCTACPLHQGRTQGVFGVGDRNAEWLFVGEAPGKDEDRLGEPFVGQAGRLLDNMLAAIGLKRGRNVYIANVLKSRPPANRDPRPEEVAACLPFLERQIDLIRPKLIVALGRFAAQSLLLTETPIGKLRGRLHSYRGIPLIVTYHPAYLLRNLPDKAKAWEDLCYARRVMAEVKGDGRFVKPSGEEQS
jgi:uracil-DNA glycosylase